VGALPKLDQVKTNDETLERLQRALQDWTERARACPFLAGELIKGVDFVAGVDRQINHHLGRTPMGWTILDLHMAAMVYRVAWSDLILVLNSSADLTADVWVF
jgi:hypothetical protein